MHSTDQIIGLNNELKKREGKRKRANLRWYPGISLEGLRKTAKNFSEASRFLGSESNLAPPENKS
jgi:hypothetical protein